MQNQSAETISKPYLFSVLLLMLIVPVLSVGIDLVINKPIPLSMYLMGKWFIFWGVGVRLLSAGLKQVISPSFTAQSIFHLKEQESFVIVRELGFANICFGLTAIISVFIPAWRVAAAFSGGLYFGIAGIQHIIKKPVSANEWVALVSDVFIFVLMAVYIISQSPLNLM